MQPVISPATTPTVGLFAAQDLRQRRTEVIGEGNADDSDRQQQQCKQ
jgi:hypothetical protein